MARRQIGLAAALALATIVAVGTAAAAKDEVLRPYVLATANPGAVADVAAQTDRS